LNAKSISILSQIADVITLILVVVMLVGIVLGIYKTIIDVKQI